jgi:hypothetical protein
MTDHNFQSVLVIGSAGFDIKGLASGPVLPGTSNAGRVRRGLGGVARNIAENLARLDVAVTLLTAVGDDDAGRQIMAHAEACGIHAGHSLIVKRAHRRLAGRRRRHPVATTIWASSSRSHRYLNNRRRLFARRRCSSSTPT